MSKLLKRLFSGSSRDIDSAPSPSGTGIVVIEGQSFDLADRAQWSDGIPHPDWDAAMDWQDSLPESSRPAAWLELERGWLDWLRGFIGLEYRLHESETALMLTTQPERLAQVKLGYLGTTLKRIERTLEEIADHDLYGKEILIAFADEDDYYRYISAFYPEEGVFGMSTGMHIGMGCGHFVTHGIELEKLEPTIVHEMTHSCVGHLPLPLWLNEGLAQSMEHRFAPMHEDPFAKMERLRKLATFWKPESIQEFWSGQAFHRPDDRQEMAYALSLALTSVLAQDWERFKAFVLSATYEDAGLVAAQECLDLDLGEFLKSFFEQSGGNWMPSPETWDDRPDSGAQATTRSDQVGA